MAHENLFNQRRPGTRQPQHEDERLSSVPARATVQRPEQLCAKGLDMLADGLPHPLDIELQASTKQVIPAFEVHKGLIPATQSLKSLAQCELEEPARMHRNRFVQRPLFHIRDMRV